MLFIKSPLVKRSPLKLVLVLNNLKNMEFSLRYTTYDRANSISVLYYRTRVTL